MKAWIEVEDDWHRNYAIGLHVSRWEYCEIGERKSRKGALNLANRWAEYLGGLEVKDLTGED